ncbi:hypothetical protein PVAG01_05251 [Phlyctema vagabunda]|uniref:Uncharacterized protein n=1 Tax=Phlyctema vagabunda TaxID=108571 RepID=A0ABR4PJK4_9HELO
MQNQDVRNRRRATNENGMAPVQNAWNEPEGLAAFGSSRSPSDFRPTGKQEFQRAAVKLHRELSRAHVFLNEFKNEFEQDITAVKGYVDQETKDSIWKCKINSKKDFHDNGMAAESSLDQLRDLSNSLKQCLSFAENPDMDFGRKPDIQQRQIDAVNRLRTKISVAGSNITDLLKAAQNGPEYWGDLILELEYSKDLTDPSKLKNVFKDAANDNAETNEDANGNFNGNDNGDGDIAFG